MKNLVKMEFPKVPKYLTDTDLESMILELEQNDMVPAPPDLKDRIMEVLEKETTTLKEQKEQSSQEKIIEYKRYRFRVLTAVAVSVLVVLWLPKFENLQQEKTDFLKPLQKQEHVIQNRYETKEEALNDSGMLETLLGGVNIFADNNKLNLFRN